MEEAPENGKESSHSAHTNGINELIHFNFIFRFYGLLIFAGLWAELMWQKN
jgi:hypothetical protein